MAPCLVHVSVLGEILPWPVVSIQLLTSSSPAPQAANHVQGQPCSEGGKIIPALWMLTPWERSGCPLGSGVCTERVQGATLTSALHRREL